MTPTTWKWTAVTLGLCLIAPAMGASVDVSVGPSVEVEQILSGNPPGAGFYGDITVYRGVSGDSRGIYEWSLPALAAGSVVTATNFQIYPMGFQAGPGVNPNIYFYGYVGNGVYTSADAVSVQNYIGQTGLITSSSLGVLSPQSYALSPSYVQSLTNNSKPFLGTVLYAGQTGYYTEFNRSGYAPGGPRLQLQANVPDVGTVHAKPIFDAMASNSEGAIGGGTYVINDGDLSINTQYYPQANVDRRGLLSFNTGGIPQGATITAATLTLDVNAITSGGAYPQIRIYAYGGSLSPSSGNATNLTELIATSDPITGLGSVEISLDAAEIQALLASNTFLGLTIVGSENRKQLGFTTSESSLDFAPTLNLSYAVPEPATLALAMPALLGLMRRRR